jgi:NAD(P)H-hydrate epimerase
MSVNPTFWLSRDEVRELDRRAIEEYGIPGVVLMENAGRGAAELLMRLNPERKPVVILCGPGNNGGDGFVIARHLDNYGWPLNVWVFAESRQHDGAMGRGVEPKLSPDAAVNFNVVRQSHGNMIGQVSPLWVWENYPHIRNALFDALKTPAWVIDAMFGTGLGRGLASPFSDVVAQVNTSRNPVLAIDIPSGLDCDTGEPLGPTIRAAHTATFVAHKKGFLNPASREWTGEVHVIDIGAPRKLIDEYRSRPR